LFCFTLILYKEFFDSLSSPLILISHHSKISRQASLRGKMEVIKSIFADRHCSFFLVVLLLLASTMSLAIAEIHHHDFVVCPSN
jgi:hypothetical protein